MLSTSVPGSALTLAAALLVASAQAHGGMDMSMDHGTGGGGGGHSMPMVFQNDIHTALFTTAWTPRNRGQYAGTCIFLVVFTILYRLMTAGKHLVEHAWVGEARSRKYIVVAGRPREADRIAPDANAENAVSDPGPANARSGVLTVNGVEENVKVVEHHGPPVQPWRWSVDVPRSLMTLVITAVGYLLMLAVMTMNIGYFMSVLAGAFLGELFLGRFGAAVDHHNH